MRRFVVPRAALVLAFLFGVSTVKPVFADGDINKVNHVIVLMQSGHSFDNYFGALAYAPGSPYHNGNGSCAATDSSCVDGLTCALDGSGNLNCSNQNLNANGSIALSFHEPQRCVAPARDPSWYYTHLELSIRHPGLTSVPQNDGFLMANSLTQLTDGIPSNAPVSAMAFYNQNELPFYYDLAQKFAIGDTYFASVAGPSFPNRSYLLAATSFGHLTSNDRFPPPGGYKPTTGTIFDLFNANGVTWANYFQDVPQGSSFLRFNQSSADPHFMPVSTFLAQAAGTAGAAALPQVSFVDPNFGLANAASENDENPPTDIQRGQVLVSRVINAVRNGPYWQDSVIFITYDQHGGFYDHSAPPPARQGGLLSPDGVSPGQCSDLSNPPLSLQPGGGAECSENPFAANDSSVLEAESLCQMLAVDPAGPYPSWCVNFDHLGVRVPLLAISPFSKPHFVGHMIADHTSILAFIERRFLMPDGLNPLHLTARDQHARAMMSLFDFDNSPSLNTPLTQAQPPINDCTLVGRALQTQQHRVLLSWSASPSQTVATYSVYRSITRGGPYTLIKSVPDSTPSYTDTSVQSGQTYFYVITSVDSGGDESVYSNEVSATIPSP